MLLDLDLEGVDSLLELVVNSFRDPPPYLLAADAFPDSAARVKALNLGADACLEKPVDAEEVFAVVNAALRRVEPPAQLEGPFPRRRSGMGSCPSTRCGTLSPYGISRFRLL